MRVPRAGHSAGESGASESGASESGAEPDAGSDWGAALPGTTASDSLARLRSRMIRSIAHKNAARVFPDPVGATTSVCLRFAIAAHASRCTRVGSANAARNQVAVGALNSSNPPLAAEELSCAMTPSNTQPPTFVADAVVSRCYQCCKQLIAARNIDPRPPSSSSSRSGSVASSGVTQVTSSASWRGSHSPVTGTI